MAQATTYAVHTEACTYLLDDGGVCCRILAPGGMVTENMTAAIGAQFVACLDLSVPGGLVAELRVGASALFTCRDEDERFVLLRTSTIRSIEVKETNRPLLAPPVLPSVPPRARPPKGVPAPPAPPRSSKPPPRSSKPPPRSGPRPTAPRPPSPQSFRREPTDPSRTEQTLRLAKPLYKPPPPAAPDPDRPRPPPVPAPRSIVSPPLPPPPRPPTPSRAPAMPPPPPPPPPPRRPPDIPPVPPRSRKKPR